MSGQIILELSAPGRAWIACLPVDTWHSPSLSDLAFTMAAADTREAIEFSVGLRRDGEPKKQREESIVNPMYLKMKVKITTSLYMYVWACDNHLQKTHCELDFLLYSHSLLKLPSLELDG